MIVANTRHQAATAYGAWRRLFGVLVCLVPGSLFAQSVTLNGSPLTGSCPLTVNLTWSSTGVATLTKSGAWTGAAALNGTQAVAITGPSAFTLTGAAATGAVNLSWTPPTTNQDGSMLTDLAGYNLYHAATAANVPTATPVQIPVGSTHTFQAPPGPRAVGLKSRNTAGTLSTMSPIATTTVVVATDSATVNATCTSVPNPPTGLVATSTVAYDLKPNGKLGFPVGTLALGTACLPRVITAQGQRKYYEVSLADVDLDTMPASAIVVTECAPAT